MKWRKEAYLWKGYTWRTTSRPSRQNLRIAEEGKLLYSGNWKGVAEADLMVKWTNKACFHAPLLLLPLRCLTACTLTWSHNSSRLWKPCAWGTAAHKNLWPRNCNNTASKRRINQGCIQSVLMELDTGKHPANLEADEVFPATLQRISTRAGAAGQRISFWQAWITLPPPRSIPWSVITVPLVISFVVKTVTHGSWVALTPLEAKVVCY